MDQHALVDWLGNGLLPIGDTIAVQINADNVKMSGFTFTNATIGIKSLCSGTQIAGNIIKGLDDIDGFVFTTGIIVEGKDSQVIVNKIEKASIGIASNNSNQTLAQNKIESSGYGIKSSGQSNTIINNIILGKENSASGITLNGLSNLVCNNTVTGQIEGIGINGIKNIIYGNNISYSSAAGINIQPHWDKSSDYKGDNVVCKNWIANNREGININSGQNNTVFANDFFNNQIGVKILWDQTGAAYEGGKLYFELDRNLWQTAYNNTVYHNNFVDNGQGAADWSWQGINMWDNDVEGNFWSDYNGRDTNQNGIGDTAYTINKPYTINDSFGDGNSRLYYPRIVNTNEPLDHFPLMVPFDIDSVIIEVPEIKTPMFELSQPEPFPVALLAAGSSASVLAIGACIVVYFKKYRTKQV
jgi:nitrous oxidase accessory protein NosD